MRKNKIFTLHLVIVTLCLILSKSFAQYSWVDSTDSSGNVIRMKINNKTGVPHRLYGIKVNFNRYGDLTEKNVRNLSRQFLTEYAKLLKIHPEALKFKSALSNDGRWFINFQQQYKGIPVYRANVGFTIHENGNVVLVGSDAYPDISINATPFISSDEALNIAKSNFAILSRTDSVEIRKDPNLIILPVENDTGYDYLLTYNIELEFIDSLSIFSEGYFIDVNTGNIIRQYSNMLNSNIYGTVKVKYWPEHYYDSILTANCKNNKVRVKNYIGQHVGSDHTNGSGYYNVNFSGGSGRYFLKSRLEGYWVKLKNTSYEHSYTFWYPPNRLHNWTHTLNDESNVYYHVDRIHDIFKNSPFNYDGMDYQMKAYINHGDIGGQSDGTNIFFGNLDVDGDGNPEHWTRSSDVIYHEYTHSVIYHLYGNRFIQDMSLPDDERYHTQGAAMDEGFAYYFACTINDHHEFSESCVATVDLENTFNMSQYDNIPGYDPDIFPQGAHLNGLIIGGACWDLHEDPAIGADYANELVFEALQMTPHAYDFEDFAENIAISNDCDAILSNSIPNFYEIEEAFETNHGITLNVNPPPALNVYVTGPSSLQFLEFGTFTANVPCIYSSPSYQWYRKNDGGSWLTRGTSQSQIERMYQTSFTMKVVVTAGSETDDATKYCVYGGGQGKILVDKRIPDEFALKGNYPNPFNPTTTIKYDLPEWSFVEMRIYDLMGREIRTLISGNEEVGYKNIVWDGTDLHGNPVSSGMYLYRLDVISYDSNREFHQTRKMVLLR